jgi:hypothetical protein
MPDVVIPSPTRQIALAGDLAEAIENPQAKLAATRSRNNCIAE